jgi:hypothetical protein
VIEPVVGDHLARHIQDQPAQRVALIGIGVDAPVLLREVLVDRALDVDRAGRIGAQHLSLLAVDDVGTRRVEVSGLAQGALDLVLYLLHRGHAAGEGRHDLGGQRLGAILSEFPGGTACAGEGIHDFGSLKGGRRAVALDDGDRRPQPTLCFDWHESNPTCSVIDLLNHHI